jgi:PAS domain S-box-containing protein
MITVLEADRTIRYVSPAVKRILGYRPEELIGTNAFDYVHPDDIEFVSNSFAEALEKPGVLPPIEFRLRTSDGSWRHMEVIRNNQLGDPAVRGVITNSRDVTERREVEGRVRFQARLLEAVGQAVIATDPQGTIIYWNRAAEELYGWSQEEAMGRSIMEVTPSEQMLERAEEIMAEILAGRSWSGEFEVRRKDGTTFPAMVTDTPVHDEQGNLVAIIGVSTNITEIKQTEELRRSEERFRLLAENAQDLIFRYRIKPTTGFEYVSPSATAMIGYTPEEYYADPELGRKIVHPDDRHLIDEVLSSPGSHITIRWFHKDGRVIWIEQRNKPFYDEAGELVAIEGISRDITERMEAEEVLRGTQEFLTGILDNAPLPIYSVSEEGRMRSANRFFADLVGMPQEKLIGALSEEVFTEEEARQFREINWKVIETENPVVEEEWTQAPDGCRYFQTIKFLLRDQDRRANAIGGISIEVTERRRAEEALRDSEERYRTLMEQSVEAIYLYDAETRRILESNAAFRRLMGYAEEELLGMRIYDFIAHDPDNIDQNVRRSLEQRRRHIGERRYRRKDGSVILVDTSDSVVSYGGRVALCAVSRDVTERREAEEAVRRSEARLAEAQQLAHLGGWEWDVRNGEISWSDQVYRIYGLKLALALLWERRAECPGAVPALVCHDEVVVECETERAADVKAWLEGAMIEGMDVILNVTDEVDVPVEADARIATSWGEGD